MSQLSFFAPQPQTLVHDASGTIVYHSHVLPAEIAVELFVFLLAETPWAPETMWMYDRTVDVPRLVARYGEGDATIPEPLRSAQCRVEGFLGERFTTIGLNYYRNERDSVAWHNDRLSELHPTPTIALLSLGATRQMLIRSKNRPRRSHAIDLEAGSLLVMGGRSQEFWEHTIPKCRRPTDARISVAFRPSRG